MQSNLFSQFTLVFEAADEKRLAELFNALFTDSEKIMFIKRLAIVLLLREEYSTYAISKTLKVSDSTVREILKRYDAGQFDPIILITRRRSFDKKRFWETVEVLLRVGLPPRGKDRWKWLDTHFKD